MFASHYKEQCREFYKLAGQKQVQAEVYREDFFSSEIEKLKKEDPRLFVLAIVEFYKSFTFFNDAEIIKRFEKLGLSQYQLVWFTSLQALIKEFDLLEREKEIIVLRYNAIKAIENYLHTKINRQVINWASDHFPHTVFQKSKNLPKNLIRSVNYERKSDDKYVHKDKQEFYDLYKRLLEESGNKKLLNQFLNKTLKGNTDSFHMSILLEGGFIPKPLSKNVNGNDIWHCISENNYLWRLSHVIALVMKGKHFFDMKDANGKGVRKESDGIRTDTIRSIKKVVKDSYTYKIPKLLSRYLATLPASDFR